MATTHLSSPTKNEVIPTKINPSIMDYTLSGQASLDYIPEELASMALDPKHTSRVYATHEPFFVEICNRWLSSATSQLDDLSIASALARILPFAPHLCDYAEEVAFRLLSSFVAEQLIEFSGEGLQELLLTMIRLLEFNNEAFASAILPAQLQILLGHPNKVIKYLVIRVFCLYLHAADAAQIELVNMYVGKGEIGGTWEGKPIDYTFFNLWEEKRRCELGQMLKDARSKRLSAEPRQSAPMAHEQHDLGLRTASLAGVLLPRPIVATSRTKSSLVYTATTTSNMRSLADAIKSTRPLLLLGPAGSGKTSLIHEAARLLEQKASMITMHTNEQTDAKLLIGMYIGGRKPGSFIWRPGVLTTAVQEGRWVVIEDLDRAPAEVISVILPLVERNELNLQNRGETLQPAQGFRLFATMQMVRNMDGEEKLQARNVLGLGHWQHVSLEMLLDKDLEEIIAQRFPNLRAYLTEIMEVYSKLRLSRFGTKELLGILVGSRELFRWCARLDDLLAIAKVRNGGEPTFDHVKMDFFLEALDCFAGGVQSQMSVFVEIIAESLNIPLNEAVSLLTVRVPRYSDEVTAVHVGRIRLAKRKTTSKTIPAFTRERVQPFALNNFTIRLCERIGAAIKMNEPCLVIGETGTGKTATIQYLAEQLNRELTVINLSQQSEAGDLLGGYKPVNIRGFAVPLKERFHDLFGLIFDITHPQNQQYFKTLENAIAKAHWAHALKLWKGGSEKAFQKLKERSISFQKLTFEGNQDKPFKRRKVDMPKFQSLKEEWVRFAVDIQVFEAHLASGSKGFAFSFVEGNIVKAARSGGWVLLDEINLASPDTIECLADLISDDDGDGRFVVLSETGNAERIHAHKDFRVFAAMNPATDVGKRDLPISLRSKFTEIFVDSPDKLQSNLVPFVKAYLGSYANADIRAASDVAGLHIEIKERANKNQLVDGAGQKPHFTLRTLARALIYAADTAPSYGLRRSLSEGFSMSYLTQLNKESVRILEPLFGYYLRLEKQGQLLFRQPIRKPENGRDYVNVENCWIRAGACRPEKQTQYVMTESVKRNFINLVRAVSTLRFPVLLQGPTSSGKTSMIEFLAKASGNKFVRINNHEHTDLQEYLGTYASGEDGQLHFEEGVLVQALRKGYWVVLDELNLAPTDVLEALNRLLDDNRELFIPETQQIVHPHKNFALFATQNPPGLYGGRKVLSRAFRNRFLECHFGDIPEDELETILRKRTSIAPSYCAEIVEVYKRLSRLRQSNRLFEQRKSFATLRDLFRWALRGADDREQLAKNGFMLLAERVRNVDERQAVKGVIEEVTKVKINECGMYNIFLSEEFVPLQSPIELPDIVWTQSMSRLYVLVSKALQSNEPILLVGETGSGKTRICEVVAEMMRSKLRTVNAHQNTEAADLIGAQRPIRDKSGNEAQLRRDLFALLVGNLGYRFEIESNILTMLEIYRGLRPEQISCCPTDLYQRIDNRSKKFKALFEWSDGSLVKAMKAGHCFLLDEISLADDAVLERLNSVLEPGRNILLAEKGPEDPLVVASQGFQFLATMNPGGDYGKKELSPALRNRFTEIWVPPLTNSDDMRQIAKARLRPQFRRFANRMVIFAQWFVSKYNHSTLSTSSIRNMLAWIDFVNMHQGSQRYFVLLHGAAMVYIDTLGANPTAKLAIAEATVGIERGVCLRKLSEVFECDMVEIYKSTLDLKLNDRVMSIGPFTLERRSNDASKNDFNMHAPTASANILRILRAFQIAKPILLEGSPGVGKTALISALALIAGIPLTRMNLSEQTDLSDLFGSDIPVEGADFGSFAWRDGPFLQALQRGDWVLLDEMNLASQSVLEGLNACLDHREEVYISELDQTFKRHRNFRLFAAQNPHHQGGGRKGLPNSFVNRFTVVYADAYTFDDMLTICRQKFPDLPILYINTAVKCVSSVSQVVLKDHRIGAYGKPWDFNLRDILRWLQLRTPANTFFPLINEIECQDLLILNRFRTIEDRDAILAILQQRTAEEQDQSRWFYNLNSETFQVGIGMLKRNKTFQPRKGTWLNSSQLRLSIVEPMMLCVENNWPCLLTGQSGSGKTCAIKQLATAVGADLTEITMDPNMDTTDLIGGFEQVDPLRQARDLKRRLLQTLRANAVKACLSVPANFLLALGSIYSKPAHTPEALYSMLTNILDDASGSTSMRGLSELAEELRSLLDRSAVANAARFEWFDGVLVKALEQGEWLVLDNANLCASSVLDRLNSLLEPGGFLSIDEQRSPDGSARVVRPHPDFRVFLTTDPRHGELSRAMRNRSIEIFVPPYTQSHMCPFSYDSKLSRFRFFQCIQRQNVTDDVFRQLVITCFFNLSFSDIALIPQWLGQVSTGLLNLSSSRKHLLFAVSKTFSRITSRIGNAISYVKDMYLTASSNSLLALELGDAQIIHPLNNPPVLARSAQAVPNAVFIAVASLLESSVELHHLEQMLASIREGLVIKNSNQMSFLERSMDFKLGVESSRPMADFLETVVKRIGQRMSKSTRDEAEQKITASVVKEILCFVRDLFDLTHLTKFDEGVFQAFLTLGRSMIDSGKENDKSEGYLADLADCLALFDSSWALSTGLCMEKLWATFRPNILNDLAELELALQKEDLADRFDELAWKLRLSINELCDLRMSIMFQADPSEARKAIDNMEASFILDGSQSPHFQEIFEGLCQYRALLEPYRKRGEHTLLTLLAKRPTKHEFEPADSSQTPDLLAHIISIARAGETSHALSPFRNNIPVLLLKQLSLAGQVHLRNLDLLLDELSTISKEADTFCDAISRNHIYALDHLLCKLHAKIFICHESYFDQHVLDFWLTFDADPRLATANHHRPQDIPNTNIKSRIPTTDYFYLIFKRHFQPSLSYLCRSNDDDHQALSHAAAAWIHFFTGCLFLYVPDKPFDPALKPFVDNQRHLKRKIELGDKLEALKCFEENFSGRKTSFRIDLVEQELRGLGEKLRIPAILRPEVSQLHELQGEFNIILNTIIRRISGAPRFQALLDRDKDRDQEMVLLRSNIAQARIRLTQNYRAYDDMTQPLIGLLQGLDIGLCLSLIAGSEVNSSSHAIDSVCWITPFLGMQADCLQITFTDLKAKAHGTDLRGSFLSAVAWACSTGLVLSCSSITRQTTLEVFHSFYDQWKDQLEIDQETAASQSSLYRFQGGQEANARDDEADFSDLFPTYDKTSDHRTSGSQATAKMFQLLANELTLLQRNIFGTHPQTSDSILNMLRKSADQIATIAHNISGSSQVSASSSQLLPCILLAIESSTDTLTDRSCVDGSYNFYSSRNINEAKRLVTLVRKVQEKFRDLQHTWPEHATLDEILRICDEVLACKHVDPIAKFLTKVEKLHSFVYEWQMVASREYSAAVLQEELTLLLVSWRRLELSTWARLLDMEDEKCKNDARSWWFLAYEIIIAVPLAIAKPGQDLSQHTTQLLSTLTEYIEGTFLGQYSHRLRLIEQFKDHLDLLQRDVPSLKIVHNALINFLGFYSRFEMTIRESLGKGRQALEKDLKEILLLASWKDTNIKALRESARRSHYSLFKVIRKYRMLLSQSVQGIVRSGLGESVQTRLQSTEIRRSTEMGTEVVGVDRCALTVCQSSVKGWSKKPARISDPMPIVDTMDRLSQRPGSTIDAAFCLEEYSIELRAEIKLLQKQTPATVAKENIKEVKHLKVRKRILFSETLKRIKKMGIRRLINTEDLAKQASIPAVFTSSPAFEGIEELEDHFHRFLDLMSNVREGGRTHSDDLSNKDAIESVSYVEGILSLGLDERSIISSSRANLRALNTNLEKLQHLWDPSGCVTIKADEQSTIANTELRRTINRLPNIIDAGILLIKTSSKLGGSSCLDVLGGLQSSKQKFEAASRSLDNQPNIPHGLSTTNHMHACNDAEECLENFTNELQSWISSHPSISFVLRQVELWTVVTARSPDLLPRSHSRANHPDARSFDERIEKVVDSILVAIQLMHESSLELPLSTKDKHWLKEADKRLAHNLVIMHAEKVNDLLQDAMARLPYLALADGTVPKVVAALFRMVLPIIQQYKNIFAEALNRYEHLHLALIEIGCTLAKVFTQIASEGFCSPSEKSATSDGNGEKLEEGTGLGEGEGAEDISKDIKDDEDLSELAQESNKIEDREETEASKDAVDMQDDAMEADAEDEVDEGPENGDASEGEGEENMDEEIGKVDELDPSAINEKLWEGNEGKVEADQEGNKSKGKARPDEQMAAQEEQQKRDGDEDNGVESEAEDEPPDEREDLSMREKQENDPYVREEESLNLPTEMELDGKNLSDKSQASDDDDIKDLSDVLEVETEDDAEDHANESTDDFREQDSDMKTDRDEPGNSEDEGDEGERTKDAGSPANLEPEDEPDRQDEGISRDRSIDADVEADNVVSSSVKGVSKDEDQHDEMNDPQTGSTQRNDSSQGKPLEQEHPQSTAEDGSTRQASGRSGDNQDKGRDDNSRDDSDSQPFKRLGDVRKGWLQQQRQIYDAQEPTNQRDQPYANEDSDFRDQDMEHLPDEDAEASTQALGNANEDQAVALDKQSMDVEMRDQFEEFLPDDENRKLPERQIGDLEDLVTLPALVGDAEDTSKPGSYIAKIAAEERQSATVEHQTAQDKDMDDLDNEVPAVNLEPVAEKALRFPKEARRLWFHYESLTRDLSFSLTEQLRLILAPTMATRMRGDFRTGKRLNIKRIIPYIASQYKRDKIWMRRSVPSKRNYQIMLAVDDSRSMGEGGGGQLAFETLALVSKSLTMLETGELCIVIFGDEVRVAHEFGQTFSSDAGIEVFRKFSFQQEKTDMRKLIKDSMKLFREAKTKTFNAGTELWQLELIISDGVFHDHEAITRLVRQAHDERIIIVFIIVDASKEASIMDMDEASFQPDENGDPKLMVRRYLDTFPFSYYLVVRNVHDLPNVLSTALRQWFAEVAGSSGVTSQ